jgi:hypothetical protein
MYDDKETETTNNAFLLILEVKRALDNGTKHFRKSDNKPLNTEKEILEALVSEGSIVFEPTA